MEKKFRKDLKQISALSPMLLKRVFGYLETRLDWMQYLVQDPIKRTMQRLFLNELPTQDLVKVISKMIQLFWLI